MIDVSLFGPAVRVAEVIRDGGYPVWFVGGCVRNALMGRPIADVDLTTAALPETVSALAESAGLKAVPTGISHGTVTVVVKGQGVEVTTLRRDTATDGRHATVAFTDDIQQDAARRDLTMNALYATPHGQVIDPMHGLPDLRAGIVRFIGDPEARIREDYLRILRFFRFTALYADPDHGIEPEGLAACAAHLDGIERLSRERIGAEMAKMLAAPDPGPAVAAMARCGALIHVLPGAGSLSLPVLVHVEQAAGLAPDWVRRLAILGGQDVADRLRLSRADAARLDRLTTAMDQETPPGELGYRMGTDAIDILALRATMMGRELDPVAVQAAAFGGAQRLPLAAADLTGVTGPALGRALRAAEQDWIDSGFTLGKDALIARHNRG